MSTRATYQFAGDEFTPATTIMIRKGLALAAAVLMSVCIGGCGGSGGGAAGVRPPVSDEPSAPPSVIDAERSEEAGEPPADEN